MRALAINRETHWVLLGTDKGDGLYRAPWDAKTGKIGKLSLAIEGSRPTYIARHPHLPVVYTANEQDNGSLSAYLVDNTNARLTQMNKLPSEGSSPCYVSVHPSGKAIYAANYSSGSFVAYALNAEGSLDASGKVAFDCRTNGECGVPGPQKDRQEASHLHCATLSPSGHHLVVCDLGTDSLLVFTLDAKTALPHPKPHRVSNAPGSGPRHVAFHPNGRWLYVIHELDLTISCYDWNHGKPTMREDSVISTVAPGVDRKGMTACELWISPDGKFAYANNRGVDEIIVYAIDTTTAKLAEQQRFGSGGKIPRIFRFDPTHRWLVACNQSAPGTIAVFAHDPATGKVDPTPRILAANTPMDICWI